MDLESLWMKVLERSTNKEASAPAQTEQTKQEGKIAKTNPVEQAMLSSSLSTSPTRPVVENGRAKNSPSGQASFYSTASSQHNTRGGEDSVDPLRGASAEQLSHILTYDGEQKGRVLDLLTSRLYRLAGRNPDHPLDVERALRVSDDGQESTPFLHLSELASRNLPRSRTWEHRLFVQYKGRLLYRGSYQGLFATRALIQEMRTFAIEATREHYTRLLVCIYESDADLAEQTALAFELLHIMCLRGHAVLANDVIVSIIVATLSSARWEEEPNRQLVARMQQLLTAARQARLPLPCITEFELRDLMIAYARRGLWDAVWDVWREPPRHMLPRYPQQYAQLLLLVARTGDRKLCARVARQCAQEAPAERPPISLQPTGPKASHRYVRTCLLACIRVADPDAEEHARTIPPDAKGFAGETADREFVKLARWLGVSYAP